MIKKLILWVLFAFSPPTFSQNAGLVQQLLRIEERQLEMEGRLRYLEDRVSKQGGRIENSRDDGNPANRRGPLDIEVIKKNKNESAPVQIAPYPIYR